MRWTIIGTLVIAAFIAVAGGLLNGVLALVGMAWLLVALRPLAAGALVATMSRQRFE
jgi:hypothetical protein